jgi:hypothetical protein
MGNKYKSLGPNQTNKVGGACGACYIFQANLLKPDLCELSNYRDEPEVIFNAAPFFKERSLVQME